MKTDLDNYITGHYGEDQLREEKHMLPAGAEVTCPTCDDDFIIKEIMTEDDEVECPYCSTNLVLINDDLKPVEDDLEEDLEEEEEAEEDEHEEDFPDEDKDEEIEKREDEADKRQK
jgi:uncharacterized Zn-finger protein